MVEPGKRRADPAGSKWIFPEARVGAVGKKSPAPPRQWDARFTRSLGVAATSTDLRSIPMPANGAVPNNPACALLVLSGCARRAELDLAGYFERLFAGNGWIHSWRNGILGTHHWHSTAHEVLGLYAGEVDVQFGGEGGPIVQGRRGDVIIVPAGVAHKRLSGSRDLGVVGAYADGRRPDMCTPQTASARQRNIGAVPLPDCDPVFGPEGPLFRYWSA